MPIRVDNNVKNQKTTPALYSDVYANIPAFGQTGRLFFATDTNTIYRDTGSAWVVFIVNATVPSGLTPIGAAYTVLGVNPAGTALEYKVLQGSSPITVVAAAGQYQIGIPAASSTVSGYLSSTDWSTFNNKIGGSLTSGYVPVASASNTLANGIMQMVASPYYKVGINTFPATNGAALSVANNSSLTTQQALDVKSDNAIALNVTSLLNTIITANNGGTGGTFTVDNNGSAILITGTSGIPNYFQGQIGKSITDPIYNAYIDAGYFDGGMYSDTWFSLAGTNAAIIDANGNINTASTGAIGIGSSPSGSFASLHIDKNITGSTTAYGVNSQGVIQSGVTTNAYYYQSNARTQAAAFTLASLQHYNASASAFGAGSAVTNQYGFLASSSLTGATNNYGFYSNLATSGTARWNFFAAGTAPNFMAGRLNVAMTSTANSVTSNFNVYNSMAVQNNDFAGGSGGTYMQFRLSATSGNTTGNIQVLGSGGTASANLIMQGAGGNVWIGTTGVPVYRLQLDTDSAAKPSTNTWTIASDSRVKTDIIPYTKGLAEILQINPVEYKYNGKAGFDENTGGIGIIAQDIQPILPETVNTYFAKLKETDKKDTELLNFNSHALTFVLINAIKELKAEIETLKQN